MKRTSFTPRSVAFLVALTLSLPPSALALRTSQLEDENQLAGLEEALRDPDKAPRQLVQRVTMPIFPTAPATPSVAPEVNQTGLEEGVPDREILERLRPVAQEIADLILSRGEGLEVIPFDGDSGSGKTTLGQAVKERLEERGQDVLLLDTDIFMKPMALRVGVWKAVTGRLKPEESKALSVSVGQLRPGEPFLLEGEWLWYWDRFINMLQEIAEFKESPDRAGYLRVPDAFIWGSEERKDLSFRITPKTKVLLTGKYLYLRPEALAHYARDLRFRVEVDLQVVRSRFDQRIVGRYGQQADALELLNNFYTKGLRPSFDHYKVRTEDHLTHRVNFTQEPYRLIRVSADSRAVIFGAGKIGRGYLAPLLKGSDEFDVIFVDKLTSVIADIEERGAYTVTPIGSGVPFQVRGIRGIPLQDVEGVAAQGPRANWVFTAVGEDNLPGLVHPLRRYITKRMETGAGMLNIVFAENLPVDQKQIQETKEAILVEAGGALRQYIQERVNFIGTSLPGSMDDEEFRRFVEDTVGFVGAVVQVTVPEQAPDSENPLNVRVEGGTYPLIIDATQLRQTPRVPAGILLVSDIQPYREKKLFIHNLGHAVLAYVSAAKGLTDPALAMQDDPEIKAVVRRAMEESAYGLLDRHSSVFTAPQMTAYIEELLGRFSNQELGDAVGRIARNPLKKLEPDNRLFGAASGASSALLKKGLRPDAITLGIYAALRYARVNDRIPDEKLQPIAERAQRMSLDLPADDAVFLDRLKRMANTPPPPLLSPAGLEERVPAWLDSALGAGWMEMVYGVHEMAEVTDKVAVLLQPALLGVAGDNGETQIALMGIEGNLHGTFGWPDETTLRLGLLTPQSVEAFEGKGYYVIRVVRHPESEETPLPWEAVPVVVAEALAGGRPTFWVNVTPYLNLKGITLPEILATLTDLFA